MRGALSHPPTATARTERATLAREGDETIESTRAAAKPREATRQPTALEKVLERPLDKSRQSLAVAKLGRMRPKRLEVVSDDLVQNGRARGPWLVLDGGQRHGRPYRRVAASSRTSGNRAQLPPLLKTLAEFTTWASSQMGVSAMPLTTTLAARNGLEVRRRSSAACALRAARAPRADCLDRRSVCY